MTTNVGLSLFVVLLLAQPHFAESQQAKKIPWIGYLGLGSGPTEVELGFKQRLRDLGWI